MSEWRDVPGYEGIYRVSDSGIVANAKTGRTRTPSLNHRGYHRISLRKDGVIRNFGVHKLVAMAFLGGLQDGKEINHIDGNKLNNSPSNLEWVTGAENIEHARDNGLLGEYKPIVAIPAEPGIGYVFRSIREATRCGFNGGNIYKVLRGMVTHHAGFKWERIAQEPRHD